MLRHPDAVKRTRQNEKRRLRNKSVISELKTLRKNALAATGETKETEFRKAVQAIDKAARKSLIHPNKAARLKSRMAKKVAKA